MEAVGSSHTECVDRAELADFLRRRRDALAPGDVGLSAGARRRAPGLRREEVAALAHMSTDFYARLEQARGSRPSEQTVAALARALRLTPFERDHLYQLAGHNAPPLRFRADQPSAGLVRVLESLASPAQIINDLGVALRQNRLAALLVGDNADRHGLDRSMIYRWFTNPSERLRHPEEEHDLHSRAFVGMLRSAQSRSRDDAEARELIDALLERSEDFQAHWRSHEVTPWDGTIKRFIHPLVGTITLDCQVLISRNVTEILVVFTALPGSDDADKLDLLSVVGGQTFA